MEAITSRCRAHTPTLSHASTHVRTCGAHSASPPALRARWGQRHCRCRWLVKAIAGMPWFSMRGGGYGRNGRGMSACAWAHARTHSHQGAQADVACSNHAHPHVHVLLYQRWDVPALMNGYSIVLQTGTFPSNRSCRDPHERGHAVTRMSGHTCCTWHMQATERSVGGLEAKAGLRAFPRPR